ncbi:MAG: glutamate racemase [Armatimonadota bacterium]
MRSPIGIFDSGLGGLSVAREVIARLPRESIIYFADTAHVPYGERPLNEIKGFALDITRFLIDEGAKCVVMACNMSSAVALDEARNRWPDIPIIGVIEPGARAAVIAAGGHPIGVLATTGTVKSAAYVRAIHSLAPSALVVQQACPRFVPLVESGRADSEEAEAAARDYVAPLVRAGCHTIVLGCTHYPFLRRAIQAAAGSETHIVDPAEETARALEKVLHDKEIASDTSEGRHLFFASGETRGLIELGSRFLRMPIREVVNHQLSGVST